jgi:radical SAM superfamily enzyme YgiQ (UPF0313 family)
MKILLVSLHVNRSPQALPLAAANLKAALPLEVQHNTHLLNFYLSQPFEIILAQIIAAQADLVAFSVYVWNRQSALKLATALRQQKNAPFIVMGGPEASADADRLLAGNHLDALVCGEGEAAFAQLVKQLSQGQPLGKIEGICYPQQPVCIPGAALRVEELPSPWLSGVLKPVAGGVLWEVARGCPFNCSFCYDAKGIAGVRLFPSARLAAELDIFNQADVSQVWVLDSTFNAPAARGHRLLQLLLERAPHLHYHLEAKAEFIDRKTIALLQKLSCSVQLGLQSTNHEVLAQLNRRINPERFWQGVELLSTAGLTFGFDLIYGLPGDSPEGFAGSLNRAQLFRPNHIDIFPLAVLPGTLLARQSQTLGLRADPQPPYLLRESREFSRQQMHDCALLAAAFDLFYNRGRAVGFLLPFCNALRQSPLEFIQSFRAWFCQIHATPDELLAGENYDNQQIFKIQQAFIAWLFNRHGRKKWLALARDILCYHFYYAETLLGPEVLPRPESCPTEGQFQLAAGVQLLEFTYDLVDALASSEIDLPQWLRYLEKTPTSALMLRRGGQVMCEAVSCEFADFLRHPQIRRGKNQAEHTEFLEFSWQQGLLERI